jgi:hypothetical protein
VTYVSRVAGDYFEVRDSTGWRRFYIKGINLGAALPGRHPSQFPDSTTYVGWLAAMGEMNVNVIRTYTIHPPYFYGALAEYNRAHPTRPLRLIHGVWAELPPEDDFNDPTWKAEFTAEMRRVVDLLHGRADIPPGPGHSSGFYTADVSEWVLAYIIGREWEPFAVRRFNEENEDLTSWNGSYLVVDNATPMDAWLAEASETMIAYETETYRHQRPIAYTSWPTLDPLNHPTETTADEEVALREALGEYVEQAPREYDNDLIALDPARVRSTSRMA